VHLGPAAGVRESFKLEAGVVFPRAGKNAQRTPLLAQLNANWRVVDDPLQWILQRKKGNPRKKNYGWRNRSFCRTREGLLGCVREYCGDVDAGAQAQLEALPDYHPDWEPREIAERT
jgi:hypothetical protein